MRPLRYHLLTPRIVVFYICDPSETWTHDPSIKFQSSRWHDSNMRYFPEPKSGALDQLGHISKCCALPTKLWDQSLFYFNIISNRLHHLRIVLSLTPYFFPTFTIGISLISCKSCSLEGHFELCCSCFL